MEDFWSITFLNTDLKILTRILSSCLQIVVDKLISSEQTCAVKGRTIQDNLHLVHTILDEIDDSADAALANLDQSKAFGRVNHHFLKATLEAAGFGKGFCNMD